MQRDICHSSSLSPCSSNRSSAHKYFLPPAIAYIYHHCACVVKVCHARYRYLDLRIQEIFWRNSRFLQGTAAPASQVLAWQRLTSNALAIVSLAGPRPLYSARGSARLAFVRRREPGGARPFALTMRVACPVGSLSPTWIVGRKQLMRIRRIILWRLQIYNVTDRDRHLINVLCNGELLTINATYREELFQHTLATLAD